MANTAQTITEGDTMECEAIAKDRGSSLHDVGLGRFVRVKVLKVLYHTHSRQSVRSVEVEGSMDGKYRRCWVDPRWLRPIEAERTPE